VPGSLSGLTESAEKNGKTAYFPPYGRANGTAIRLNRVKNCARIPRFSLRFVRSDRPPASTVEAEVGQLGAQGRRGLLEIGGEVFDGGDIP